MQLAATAKGYCSVVVSVSVLRKASIYCRMIRIAHGVKVLPVSLRHRHYLAQQMGKTFGPDAMQEEPCWSGRSARVAMWAREALVSGQRGTQHE